MANLIMNNINLGPIIDVYQELPTTSDYINEHAVYRLYKRKFDIEDGHGKDNENYPVGYYKPAEGSRWTWTTVERGSSGVYMDGYAISPCNKMRNNNVDTSWNPVPCSKEEASGIWYYDYEKDNVYLKWNSVGYGAVNPYTLEMLDKALGTSVDGYYVWNGTEWKKINVEADVMTAATVLVGGEAGLVPTPPASKYPKVLTQEAEWTIPNMMSGCAEPFNGAINRSVENIGDSVMGYSWVTETNLTLYTNCSAVIEWNIVRTSADTLEFQETAHEFSGCDLFRNGTITCTENILTEDIINEGKTACGLVKWTSVNEHYDNEYITTPDSYLVFGKYSADYRLSLESPMQTQKFEYDHAARFTIDGQEVYGTLSSIGTVVNGIFTVTQEIFGSISGKTRASQEGTGHYMRIGHAPLTTEYKLEEAMPLIVWDDWVDLKNYELCTVYITKDEYDAIIPDPNIIYTIID